MSAHPTALVDPGARLGRNVRIGPFCTVGPGVEIGDDCVLMAHVHIDGPTTVGISNVFHPTARIGGPAQDVNARAPSGPIRIGDRNVFREATTVNAPKMPGGRTRIGDRNRFHFSSHVGHDSEVEDDAFLESGFVLGGHSRVASGARCGPHGGTHQFATVGRLARVRSHVPVTTDVPPFMEVDGNHYRVLGVNHPALHHLPAESVDALRNAVEVLWRSGRTRSDALTELERDPTPEVIELVSFLRRSMEGRMGRAREGRS